MFDVLRFPKEFQVSKRMGKERYLKHGNLTERERRLAEGFLKDTSLLYSIPCDDRSEMIVLLSEVEPTVMHGSYWLNNLMNAIAQSFPYTCMIVLKCQGTVSFYVFDKHQHSYDSGRSVVENTYATPTFDFVADKTALSHFAWELRTLLPHRASATKLHSLWKNAIIKSAGGIQKALDKASVKGSTLRYEACIATKNQKASIYHDNLIEDAEYFNDMDAYEDEYAPDDLKWEEIERNAYQEDEWDDSISLDSHLDNSQYSDLYDGKCITGDNAEDEIFIEFCATHCWPLFCEAIKFHGDIAHPKWLTDYFSACNEYANAFLGLSINSQMTLRIRNAFLAQETSVDDGYDLYDVQFLKKCLWKYFKF